MFGFLGGREIKEAGLGNLGLQDRESSDPTASVLPADAYAYTNRTHWTPLGAEAYLGFWRRSPESDHVGLLVLR